EPPSGSESHWSLRPVVKPAPALPTVKDPSWARTPTDRFILAKLEEKGLKPSAAADKRTLLRRIYFDLVGLPPTPEEMKAFLADKSPRAYDKVVERLLASPRYGERWARHWLDVAHYAETHGHDQDRVRTNSWPYRDYVINSFNADKPYARFIEEQIAGDVLFPDDPQAVVAMGFLATGPWDESSLRDIRDDTIDRQIARYLDRDDIVTTVMNTFVSATVQCARCHNHKFDPISQDEYYGLQAVFAATDKANRFYDPDRQIHAQRRALLQQKQAIERKDRTLVKSLGEAAFQKELAAWEKALTNRPIAWTILNPLTCTSSNGATLTKQPDGSVLSTGKRAETDTYTITASLGGALEETRPTSTSEGRARLSERPAPLLTAFRLEVMTDDSLPHKGPGRQDNGNLHLNEVVVTAAGKKVALRSARADFDQQGWTASHAIDGNPGTAWGIYPEVGRPHSIVLTFAQ